MIHGSQPVTSLRRNLKIVAASAGLCALLFAMTMRLALAAGPNPFGDLDQHWVRATLVDAEFPSLLAFTGTQSYYANGRYSAVYLRYNDEEPGYELYGSEAPYVDALLDVAAVFEVDISVIPEGLPAVAAAMEGHEPPEETVWVPLAKGSDLNEIMDTVRALSAGGSPVGGTTPFTLANLFDWFWCLLQHLLGIITQLQNDATLSAPPPQLITWNPCPEEGNGNSNSTPNGNVSNSNQNSGNSNQNSGNQNSGNENGSNQNSLNTNGTDNANSGNENQNSGNENQNSGNTNENSSNSNQNSENTNSGNTNSENSNSDNSNESNSNAGNENSDNTNSANENSGNENASNENQNAGNSNENASGNENSSDNENGSGGNENTNGSSNSNGSNENGSPTGNSNSSDNSNSGEPQNSNSSQNTNENGGGSNENSNGSAGNENTNGSGGNENANSGGGNENSSSSNENVNGSTGNQNQNSGGNENTNGEDGGGGGGGGACGGVGGYIGDLYMLTGSLFQYGTDIDLSPANEPKYVHNQYGRQWLYPIVTGISDQIAPTCTIRVNYVPEQCLGRAVRFRISIDNTVVCTSGFIYPSSPDAEYQLQFAATNALPFPSVRRVECELVVEASRADGTWYAFDYLYCPIWYTMLTRHGLVVAQQRYDIALDVIATYTGGAASPDAIANALKSYVAQRICYDPRVFSGRAPVEFLRHRLSGQCLNHADVLRYLLQSAGAPATILFEFAGVEADRLMMYRLINTSRPNPTLQLAAQENEFAPEDPDFKFHAYTSTTSGILYDPTYARVGSPDVLYICPDPINDVCIQEAWPVYSLHCHETHGMYRLGPGCAN